MAVHFGENVLPIMHHNVELKIFNYPHEATKMKWDAFELGNLFNVAS